LKAKGLNASVFKGVLDCAFGEGLFTKPREVSEEGLDVILSLKGTDSIHNSGLLMGLPLLETANIKGLN
jgi:hypothetical protein